jgi:hypothetical protein
MERFEESASSVYHASNGGARGGAKSMTSRVVSSGTTIHNHGASGGHSHGHEHSEGNSIFSH